METLKLSKVFTGRIFCAEDLIGVLMERKFLGELYARAMKFDPYVGVGCNPMTGFDAYFRRASPFPHRFVIDFKRWDKTLAKSLVKILRTSLGEVNPNLKQCFNSVFNSVYETYHISGTTMYYRSNGQPSGSAGTAVTNSLYNLILTYTVFSVLYKEQFYCYPTWEEFKRAVQCFFYGDDQFICTVYPWFNRVTFAAKVKELFNMNADAMDKAGKELSPFDEWEDCNWISRYWRKLDEFDFRVGALKKMSIGAQFHWTSNSEISQIAHNIQWALEEASIWDEEYYEKVKQAARIILQHFPQYRGEFYIPSRESLQLRIYNEALTPKNLMAQSNEAERRLNSMNIEKLLVFQPSGKTNDMASMILNRFVQVNDVKLKTDYTREGPQHLSMWTCIMTLDNYRVCAEAHSKKIAREMASQKMCDKLGLSLGSKFRQECDAKIATLWKELARLSLVRDQCSSKKFGRPSYEDSSDSSSESEDF